MPEYKLIVSDPKTGKSEVKELKGAEASIFTGLKIGDTVDLSSIGVKGKVKVTGGSDKAGFPMRADVLGGVKRRVLLTKGVGYQTGSEGEKRRKLVRGNTITEEIYQVNGVLVQ
ncbi:MAG: 30S ribosomal protein S6e [Thaumarchaeota archaeon]|nr:30S ribosomal protein S6e [Nitrososphaerota archaeon]